jgi:hypothetical protein
MEGMEGRARNANRLLLVPSTSIGVPLTHHTHPPQERFEKEPAAPRSRRGRPLGPSLLSWLGEVLDL